jgi:hypothetical protein
LLIEVFRPLLWSSGGNDFDEQEQKLRDVVLGMTFSQVHRLLKPAFDSFPGPDLANAEPINNLRNQVAHDGDVSKIVYKGRNPFRDADCVAELFFDWQGFHKEIGHFHERMIEDPQYAASQDAEFRRQHDPGRFPKPES